MIPVTRDLIQTHCAEHDNLDSSVLTTGGLANQFAPCVYATFEQNWNLSKNCI
jgi:hypothetical protein